MSNLAFSSFTLNGVDAQKFLQGQITCDLNKLSAGANTLGAYSNIKGKVESMFRIWRLHEDYYLRLPASMVEATMQELQKYAIFSKVQLLHASNHLSGFGVYDSQLNLDLLDPELSVLEILPGHRYEIYGTDEKLEKAWHQCMARAKQVDPAQWELLDIEASIPEVYPETSAEFFPHDLNLPALNAVSFTKGCFRGQEIIARMQHRGNLKRRLCTFNVAACDLKPGDLITAGGPENETAAGKVVRFARNISTENIGLAVINDSVLEQQLYIGTMKISLS